MAAALSENEDVTILPPDLTLQKKLGNASLDKLFSPQTVQAAQQAIIESSDQLLDESMDELKKIEQAFRKLCDAPDNNRVVIGDIIDAAFSLKAKAGLGGYDLVAALAKSLHLRCESMDKVSLAPTTFVLIKWYVESMKKMLELKIKGSGGETGEAIFAALAKIDSTEKTLNA